MTFEEALSLVRLMIDRGVQRDAAIENPAIPVEFREQISERLAQESEITLEPARFILADQERGEWLHQRDRSDWYYWPRLREYILGFKGWNIESVRSLDDITDRILGQLAPPEVTHFDIRGLVLGYVQSGKTSNFTALISKAADIGYRLVIVLSGIDKGLRLQTQIRLKRELIGFDDDRVEAVPLPPIGKRWHEFTREELDGDFSPGFANHAALQGSQPVLLVVKKNAHVLRRLLGWLNDAPDDVKRTIPMLVVDDEADQASIDTRGTYQGEDDALDDDYEPPSVINGLIRDLLLMFNRRAYVAYTATPYANILIPHDIVDPARQNDLYPKDFIVDLPKPEGYFGTEELFGRYDSENYEEAAGLDVIRIIPDEDLDSIESGEFPGTLEFAILDFILAGAGRINRREVDLPATMLIHISRLNAEQGYIASQVNRRFNELRDEWRYQRGLGIRDRLQERWNNEFRPVTQSIHDDYDVPFEEIESHIGPFFESIQVRVVNSEVGDVLDYIREPNLKVIAIGGDKLSRGLTLEGLLISYYARRSYAYDTLMQMGRWFGFRAGYEDITRIYTTQELASWFSDLSLVEHRLRTDIGIYERQGLTPLEVGMRVWRHPTMQVTSPVKRRYARRTIHSQSYALMIEQTFKFPLTRLDDLARQLTNNLSLVREMLPSLGTPHLAGNRPVWLEVPADFIIDFLGRFSVDAELSSISLPLIRAYIQQKVNVDELVQWTIAICGRDEYDSRLGIADWGIEGGTINQINMSRLRNDVNSIGVITSPGDEAIGLSPESREHMQTIIDSHGIGKNPAARQSRPSSEGLLLLYPISKYSIAHSRNRINLYENPDDPRAHDLIGLAISFPGSQHPPHEIEAYWEGTVGWRLVE